LRIRTDVTWDDVCKNYVAFKPEIFAKKKAGVLEKQHSILFTSIPSFDLLTGDKIITDDDACSDKDDTEKNIESEKHNKSSASSTSELPLCKYGAKCYQIKPEHTSKYAHPWRDKAAAPPISKIPCKYGKDCRMKSEYHLSHYTHDVNTDESDPMEEDRVPTPYNSPDGPEGKVEEESTIPFELDDLPAEIDPSIRDALEEYTKQK